MPRERATRAQLIGRRWRLVGASTLFAFVLTFLVGRFQRESLEKFAQLPSWSIVIAIVSAVALFAALAPRRFVATLGLRHPFLFPPYWFGIAIGIAIALLLIARTEVFAEDFQLSAKADDSLVVFARWLGLAPAVSVVLASFLRWLFSWGGGLKTRSWDDPQPPTLERFRAWIQDDGPVIAPSGDLFGHATIARRMAQRLLKETASQALVGRLGSGKSTVRALVEAWLKDQNSNIEIVHVELWPYESPRAAVEGILTTVVEAISREVSTSQLEGVPAAYGEAIAKASGVADWFPKVLRKQTTPAESLQRLDEIATIINRRYVLWVEDLERFAAGDPNALAGESELERLAPIRAVLHGLDQLRSMIVVTATTDLFRRFDMEKIARYVEPIPELKFRDARRIISMIRRQLIEGDVLDPAAAGVRARLGWDDPNEPRDERLELALLGDTIATFASAVAALASTPRILKQGLRRALESWDALRGEIDLDELIALSILREAHPGVFALVDKHANALRAGRPRDRDRGNPMETFAKALGQLLGDDKRTFEAVRLIADELFGHEARRRPQGVWHDNHADYWQRFLAVPELPKAERDQDVLTILRENDEERIVDLLVSDRSAAVEDFGHLLSPRRVEQLLVPLTRRVLDHDVTTWAEHRPPGLVPLWRMLRKKNHRDASEISMLVSEIERALELAAPRNLVLLYEIAHWMASHSPEVTDLLPAAERQRINDRARDLLVQTYRDRPQELATRLRGAPPFLLVWLCWTIDRVRAGSTRGIPFADWAPFGETLLNALPVDATSVAPQIASLLVRSRRRLRGPDEWIFDEAQCQALFGDVEKIVEAIRAATTGMEIDARVLAVIERTTDVETTSEDDDDDEIDADEEYWSDADEDGDEDDDAADGEPVRVGDTASRVAPLLDDTERAMRSVAQQAGVSPRAGSLAGQVDGYWYDRPEDIPASRPTTDASAILPEKVDLGDGSLCLLLVEVQGEWSPLSQAGIEAHTRASALFEGQTRYFVLADNWPRTYQARFDGLIEVDEVSRRFGEQACDRARAEIPTMVIEVIPFVHEQPSASPVGAAPAPTGSIEAPQTITTAISGAQEPGREPLPS